MANSQAHRSAPAPKSHHTAISRKQVDIVLSRSVAAGSLVFAAQTAQPLVSQAREANLFWLTIILAALLASLVAALVCSIVMRFVRLAHGAVAVAYVIALITWPFFVVHAHSPTTNHWLYFLVTVGTSTAAIAFSSRVAILYLFIVPAIYGVVRLTPQGGAEGLQKAVLDSLYSIILGGAVLILITLLRQTASSVDLAQSTALESYGHAVRHHATEIERVQVDSIVHDSVLTSLISAARAYTPQAKELAAAMASNAIGYLHDAALVQPDDGSTVRLSTIVDHIAETAKDIPARFDVRISNVGPGSIPASAGEAVFAAASQAMFNSVQHGGNLSEIDRWVSVRPVRPNGIEVVVGDTGRGFSLDAVPTARLGVRVSIIERLSNAGGVARIVSSPNHGAVVTVRWPAAQPSLSAVAPAVPDVLIDESEVSR